MLLAVLRMFGNGRPSTNRMLRSDSMANDTVLRPFESLPLPRLLSSWRKLSGDLFFLHTGGLFKRWRGGPQYTPFLDSFCEGNMDTDLISHK